ncbi:DUF5719 family protein [Microbacterium sp.]|uniref:DUF5719 family protein n=1 Tax=Microbacterium sp. TaxID=51671 RepID=UPI00281247BD|nr:DUF5719 family protein [Microbacterium sp.]
MRQRTIRLAATGARIATGAVVAAACVLGVVSAVAAPLPGITREARGTTVTPIPGDTVLICNGSYRVLGRDAGQAQLMVSAALPQLRSDAEGEPAQTEPLAMPDVAGGARGVILTGVVADRKAQPIAASESVRIDAEDARGFAAAPCREAAMSTWLVGGDVSTGAGDVIVLSNPGDVPANVDLLIYGESRAASNVVIPPKSQRGVPLASIAAGERSPVVQVVASGAPVRATLQSTLIRTLDAVGIDMQDGVGGAQHDLQIVGVRAQTLSEGDDAAGVVVRMLSPEQDAEATVRVRASESTAVLEEYPVSMLAGTPGEIALSGIPTGVYDIEIESDQPIVAAAHQTARAGAETDFAWMTPAPEISSKLMFSVPAGPSPSLHLRNTRSEAITVQLEGDRGGEIEVPAFGAATVPLSSGAYSLSPSGPVHAAVAMRGGDGSAEIAGWPLWAGAAEQQPIVVHP